MSKFEQWVNLEKNSVEEDGVTKERMGPFLMECEFKKAKLAAFKVKVLDKGGSGKAKYKRKEERRNKNFTLRKVGAVVNDTKKKIKLQKKVYLAAAGGNKYKVSAKFKGKVVESGKELETRRKLWYQPLPMKTLTHKDYTYSDILQSLEDAYWNEKEKFFIKLSRQSQTDITFKNNLKMDITARNWIWAEAAKGYSIKKYNPHAFGLAFVGHLAKLATIGVDPDFKVSLSSSIFTWNPSDQEFVYTAPFYLWYDLDPNDDKNDSWLVGTPTMSFVPDGGGAEEKIPCTRKDFTLTGSPLGTHGGRHKIRIKLCKDAIKRDFFTKRKGKLKIHLDLRKVDGWILGYSEPNHNLVVVGTRCQFEDMATDTVKYVANHEVGHAIGMVSDGKGPLPDAPSSLYGDNRGVNDRTHQGPHCGTGATWTEATTTWSGAPGCVMFGANGIANNHAPPTYCSECAPIVRKLDLSHDALKKGSFKNLLT